MKIPVGSLVEVRGRSWDGKALRPYYWRGTVRHTGEPRLHPYVVVTKQGNHVDVAPDDLRLLALPGEPNAEDPGPSLVEQNAASYLQDPTARRRDEMLRSVFGPERTAEDPDWVVATWDGKTIGHLSNINLITDGFASAPTGRTETKPAPQHIKPETRPAAHAKDKKPSTNDVDYNHLERAAYSVSVTEWAKVLGYDYEAIVPREKLNKDPQPH